MIGQRMYGSRKKREQKSERLVRETRTVQIYGGWERGFACVDAKGAWERGEA